MMSEPINCTPPETSPGRRLVTPEATVFTSPFKRLMRSPLRNFSSDSQSERSIRS